VKTGTSLVTNGDFEQGNTGFESEYKLHGASGTKDGEGGDYLVTDDPKEIHGYWAKCSDRQPDAPNGKMLYVNGAAGRANAPIGAKIWCQTITVKPNTDYVFSASYTPVTDEAYPKLAFSFNGTSLPDPVPYPTALCGWKNFQGVWNSGSSTKVTICISETSGVYNGNDFAIDDISLYKLSEVSSSVTVTVNSKKTPEFVFLPTGICEGSLAPMLVKKSANGISGTWSPEAVDASTPGKKTHTFTPNAGECAVPKAVEFTVDPKPKVTLAAVPERTRYCEGETITLKADGADTYTWSGGGLSGSGSEQKVLLTETTTYQVTGTESANGCLNMASVAITVHPKLKAAIAATRTSICTGQSVTLTASGGQVYFWNHNLGYGQTKTVRPKTTTTYKVKASDVKHCSDEASVTITVHSRPDVTLTVSENTICPGGSVTLTASGADTYIWSGEGTSGNGPVQTVSPKSDATYGVTGIDKNGCENAGVLR